MLEVIRQRMKVRERHFSEGVLSGVVEPLAAGISGRCNYDIVCCDHDGCKLKTWIRWKSSG